MLVLTRKIGQEIVIGGDIRIKVVAVDGGRVRIGVIAPEDVIVDRQEIHEKRLTWADNAICQPVAASMPQLESAPCPFDGNEPLLVDSEAVYSDDASPLKPYLATPTAAQKNNLFHPMNAESN